MLRPVVRLPSIARTLTLPIAAVPSVPMSVPVPVTRRPSPTRARRRNRLINRRRRPDVDRHVDSGLRSARGGKRRRGERGHDQHLAKSLHGTSFSSPQRKVPTVLAKATLKGLFGARPGSRVGSRGLEISVAPTVAVGYSPTLQGPRRHGS